MGLNLKELGHRLPMQLAPVGVECVLLEEIAQAGIPLGGLRMPRL
jgi:hypothetical protein